MEFNIWFFIFGVLVYQSVLPIRDDKFVKRVGAKKSDKVNAKRTYKVASRYVWIGPGFECLDASVCELTRGSIFMAANRSRAVNLKAAFAYAIEHLKSHRLRDKKIGQKCGAYALECWSLARLDAVKYMNLPLKLANACDGSVLPNMLLFCEEDSNGLEDWPPNIKYILGNNTLDYSPCRSSCNHHTGYKEYHLKNGKKSKDFPEEWKDSLISEEESEPETMQSEDSKVDIILANFITSSPHNASTKSLQCLESSWNHAFSSKRPFNLNLYCRNSFTHITFPSQAIFPTKENLNLITQEQHVNIFGITSYKVDLPGGLHFIVGLRLRLAEVDGMSYYNITGVKYSGAEFYNYVQQYDWEMMCPVRSAICSMELGSFGGGKYVDIISVGCCSVPPEIYLNVTAYEPLTIPSNRLEAPSNVGTSFNSYLRTVSFNNRRLGRVKVTFLCERGEFIVAMEHFYRLYSFESRPIPFVETNYYCGNGRGGPRKRLESGLYDYKPYTIVNALLKTEENRKIHEKYYPYKLKFDKKIECPSGFVNQYRISRYYSGNRDRKFKSMDWAETIWCTPDSLKNYSAIKSFYHESKSNTNMDWCGYKGDDPVCDFQYSGMWETEVKCKENEAVCGMTFEITKRGKRRSYVTEKIYHIHVVCCTTPPKAIENTCCKAVDEYVAVPIPGKSTFYFQPSDSLFKDQMELIASVSKYLSPSRYSQLNWEDVIRKNYLKIGGHKEVTKTEVVSGHGKENECPPKRKVWKKFTATCAATTAVYYEGPEYTTTITNCKNSLGDKCPDFCLASDRWLLYVKIEKYVVNPEDDFEARSGGGDNCPLLQFKPAIKKDDYNYLLIENAVRNQLSPSPTTGINYMLHYADFYAGETKADHIWTSKDVPEGRFMNVYQAILSCGNYSAVIQEWKMQLFKTGDKAGNCGLAKANGVPLEGCK